METRRDVFQAISDPTRREIISLLASQFRTLDIGNYAPIRGHLAAAVKRGNSLGFGCISLRTRYLTSGRADHVNEFEMRSRGLLAWRLHSRS